MAFLLAVPERDFDLELRSTSRSSFQERARDVASMSALTAAVAKGDLECVKRLGADVKKSNAHGGFTPFICAATKGKIPIMHWLLTEGGSSLADRL
jgi:ankyrin repeat protein